MAYLHVLFCEKDRLKGALCSRHLARFSFTPTTASKSSPIEIKVYRADPSATQPFFSATIHPISYLPSFPMNSAWVSYLGMSNYILQPPLPEGDPAAVVVGTNDWKRSSPILKSKRARMVWIDMRQPDGDRQNGEAANKGKSYGNWWPGMRRWQLGMIWEDTTLELGAPEVISR